MKVLELLICGLGDSYELIGAVRVLSENESPFISDYWTTPIFLMCAIKFQIQEETNVSKKIEMANADRSFNYFIQHMNSNEELEDGESLSIGMCLFKNKETNEYKISLHIDEGEKSYAKKDLSENALNAQLEILNNKKLIRFLKKYDMLTEQK